MGKEDKEESGFGFKDKAKALETLRLLESHDFSYRRLTVRGLLGRAKRVLSMTKAEDKIKNIKEAMEVFENWLSELEKNKDNSKEKKEKVEKKDKKEQENGDTSKSDSDVEMEEKPKAKQPTDKVPNLGFKDKAAAEATLKELEGRDPDYQSLAVKGLLKSAKRVLTCTKDETKLANIKEAMSILEKYLDEFDSQHLGRQNNPYLSLGLVRTCQRLAKERELTVEHQNAFIVAYAEVGGDYKRLRTVPEKEGGKTWDIIRNTALSHLKEKHAESKLFTDKDEPTNDHLEMLLWAYSPEQAKVKKLIQETKEESSRKRKSSGGDHDAAKKHKD